MMKLLRALFHTLTALLLIIAMTAFSFFMYAHIVEKVFYVDLPLVGSVSLSDEPVRLLPDTPLPQEANKKYGFYGAPILLKMPRLGFSLITQESRREHERWIVSSGVVSYVVASPSQSGRLGNTIMFSSPTSPVFNSLYHLVEGDRLVVETAGGWRHNYRVARKIAMSTHQDFYPESTGANTLILVKKVAPDTLLIVEAEYLSVEELQP